jgi:hypothetical protein
VRTIDGTGTFHGMGLISASVVETVKAQRLKMKRLKGRVKVTDVVQNRGMPIVPYALNSGLGLSGYTMTVMQASTETIVSSAVSHLDLLWHAAGLLQLEDCISPNWSGYMSSVCVGQHSRTAEINFLPIVDMNPNDESCIYSTLLFVQKEAVRLGIEVPCITFDQPLYIKAVDICNASKLDIVVRLGGFHLLMNFMGAVGHVMRGSGLEDVLRVIYGPVTIEAVLSGKSYARAVRGHFLVQRALNQLLLHSLIPSTEDASVEQSFVSQTQTITAAQNTLDNETLTNLKELYNNVCNENVCLTDCEQLQCESLLKTEDLLNKLKIEMASDSRTARLWLQYMHYVHIIKLFITAERTGNWCLHLDAVHSMLNLFAAAGHSNYAKSGRLYLQTMRSLPKWLSDQFAQGLHSVRLSDKLWAGLSTDYVIETQLMRSLKSRGGLTRGSGMTETVRTVYVHTMTESANVSLALSQFSGLHDNVSDHAENGASRRKRDWSDLQKLLKLFQLNSPFRISDGDRLVSLSSGVVAVSGDCVTSDY